jgi:hypothetical protein
LIIAGSTENEIRTNYFWGRGTNPGEAVERRIC